MESKKENNHHQKIQEYSGEISEIPSRPPPPTIVIRNGNDNWRFEYLSDRQTDSRDPPSRIYLPMESKKNKNVGDSG